MLGVGGRRQSYDSTVQYTHMYWDECFSVKVGVGFGNVGVDCCQFGTELVPFGGHQSWAQMGYSYLFG